MSKESYFYAHLWIAGLSDAALKTLAFPFHRSRITIPINNSRPNEVHRGVLGNMKRIIKNEGIFSLWNGNLGYIIRSTPSIASSFAFHALLKSYYWENNKTYSRLKYYYVSLASGALAGFCSVCITYPLHAFQGLKHFQISYKGMSLSLATTVPHRAIYFASYDCLKQLNLYRPNQRCKDDISLSRLLYLFAQGQIASSITTVLTNPIQKVAWLCYRTRECDMKLNMIDGFRKIIREGGVTSLWRGMRWYNLQAGFLLTTFDFFNIKFDRLLAEYYVHKLLQ